MDDSFNDTKEGQRHTYSEESMLESSSGISESLHKTTSTTDSGIDPMDISKQTCSDSDNASTCSSPSSDTKYFCPLCDVTLTSQHEFTLHIRSHNNDNEIISDKGFTCRICSKVLSSNSSLDRHMLVHSGERPFSCKICSVTFTTNGNMHRHMRTHSQKTGENYESDGSTDSNNSSNSGGRLRKQRRLEFNNNKLIDNKRKADTFTNEDDYPKKLRQLNNNNNINENLAQSFRCPVCSREDFTSLNILEQHLEDNHPDFEVKCASCNLSFKNNKALNLHRLRVHHSEQLNNINNKNLKNSVVGFKDLTFVDFSSEKFPHIARYACEKNLHKPITGQKFICDRCTLAFPCASALEIHKEACIKGRDCRSDDNPTDLSRKSDSSEEDLRRDNFFAHLDLQNKSTPSSPTNNESKDCPKVPQMHSIEPKNSIDSKDLADIQSILSMASNESLLKHLRAKPTPDLLSIPQESHPRIAEHQEEETQDVFAAEFRKMKLRGEFPCRLCTAVFPNLRALKGHNRAHLTGTGNTGPYRCNMCPHSSVDKAALIRHMRTHNGDRPYECAVCNYAFTTKANCERHLRNRHSKVTRDEVKKAIIYHPSEDPTNDDNKLNSSRDEFKRSFLNSSSEEDRSHEKINSSTPKDPKITPNFGLLMPKDLGLSIPSTMITKDLPSLNLSMHKEQSPLLHLHKEPFKEKLVRKDEEILKQVPFNLLKIEENLITKSNCNSLDGLKQIPEYEPDESPPETTPNSSSNYEDYSKSSDHPIDLSMDVLDLSKKKTSSPTRKEEPVDFTKKTLENSNLSPTVSPTQLLLAQQLLKNPFYASQLSQYYQNHAAMFPGLQNLSIPQVPLNPFIFASPFLDAATAQEMKERMLRFQLSGGELIRRDQFPSVPSERLQSFQQPSPVQEDNFSPKIDADEIKPPLHINTHVVDNYVKIHSPKAQPKTPELSHSPNSVKMVIKNGVLMPKQKQRRYRTERPFSCEHCSARFTLRSNMERHIKQQHPQFWSQRQRSGITAGRKPGPIPITTLSGSKPSYYDLNIPNYDVNVPKIPDSLVNNQETKEKDVGVNQQLSISQQVKYAILAQHLKSRDSYNNQSYPSPTKEKIQDEDEDALIIDEEDDKNSVKAEPKDFTEHSSITDKSKSLDEKMLELRQLRESEIKQTNVMKSDDLLKIAKSEEGQDLVPVSRLLDNAVSSQLPFREYFRRDGEENETEGVSEEDEEGLVASGSTSEGNGSSGDEHK